MPRVFFLYPNSSQRKKVLKSGTLYTGKIYTLFCLDKARAAGLEPIEDLDICESIESAYWGPRLWHYFNRIVELTGGIGGDWYKLWRLRKRLATCDIIFSTTDRVGLPLLAFMRWGIIAPRPVVYVSIGLSERIRKLKGLWVSFYRGAFQRHVKTLVTYGALEKEELNAFLGSDICRFIPFGVDVEFFAPPVKTQEAVNQGTKPLILCMGADSFRDFDLLLHMAPKLHARILLVTLPGRFPAGYTFPDNVEHRIDVPFNELPGLFQQADIVALPVKENSYSGATSTLLQAMSMARPVIVSQTGAIRSGYPLRHGENVWLVPPGDASLFEKGLQTLLADPLLRVTMGQAARESVVRDVPWTRFCKEIMSLFRILHVDDR